MEFSEAPFSSMAETQEYAEPSPLTAGNVSVLLPKRTRKTIKRIATTLGNIRDEAASSPHVKDSEVSDARWNQRLFSAIGDVLAETESRGAKKAPDALRGYMGMIVAAAALQLKKIDHRLLMESAPVVMQGQEPDEDQQRYLELQNERQAVGRAYGYAQDFIEPEHPNVYAPAQFTRSHSSSAATPVSLVSESSDVRMDGLA